MCVPLRISAYLWAWSRELFTTFLVFFFFLQGYTLVGDNFLLIVTQRLGSRTAPDRDRRGSALICWSWADGICRFRGNSLQQESYGSELALNADMGVSPDMHFHAFVFLVAQFGQWPHRGHIHTVMFCFFTSPWQLCVSRLKSTFFFIWDYCARICRNGSPRSVLRPPACRKQLQTAVALTIFASFMIF